MLGRKRLKRDDRVSQAARWAHEVWPPAGRMTIWTGQDGHHGIRVEIGQRPVCCAMVQVPNMGHTWPHPATFRRPRKTRLILQS
jgi:hypothetical protein